MIKIILTVALFVLSITLSFGQKKWSLQECIDYAFEHNISLIQAQLNENYVQEDVTIAKARLLPFVSASASQNISIGNKYKRFNPSNNIGLSASYPIYNAGRNKLLINQAKNIVATNTLNIETQQNNIALQIANNYLNALFNKENIKLAEEQINITTLQLQQIQALIDAGVKPRVEALDIKATLASNNEQLIIAENTLNISLLNLAQLIQTPYANFDIENVELNIDKAILTYSNANGIYETALLNRPEIKRAQLNIDNADLAIKIAKTNLLPTVSANYGLNTSYAYRFSGDGRFNKIADQYFDNHGHNFGISASINIFDGKTRKTNIKKAKINKEIISQGLENEKLNLRLAIERAYLDAKSSLKQYESSLSSLKAQQASFVVAQERQKLGAINSFDFDLVVNRLFRSKIALINAKYNFVFKSKVLDFYNNIPIIIE